MLGQIWERWQQRRREREASRSSEEAGMSKEERAFVHESVDDRQADAFVEEHLGGGDPAGPVRDDDPSS